MNAPWNDIAHRARALRRAACLGLLCALLLTGNGCSWLSFWSGGDPSVDVDGHSAGPDEVAAAKDAVRAKTALAPQEPYWPFRMGELYAAGDSTGLAISHLQSALELDPGYAPAAALLSKLYYETANYGQAVVLLEGFLAENSESPDALRAALALHLEALGDVDRAQAVLDKCSGDSRAVRDTRTFVSLRGDDLDAALETATRSLEENPKSAANQNNYGIAMLYAGRPVEARSAFLAALKLDERLPGALYNMAIVEAFYFFDEEKGREWFARYKQYASDDPDGLEAVFGTDLTELSNDGDSE